MYLVLMPEELTSSTITKKSTEFPSFAQDLTLNNFRTSRPGKRAPAGPFQLNDAILRPPSPKNP